MEYHQPPDDTPAPGSAPVAMSHRARMEILFAILLALFLSALDQTIVGTALPRIVTDLGGNDLYTWVVTIYLLTATITGPVYGKLSDQFGRRPLLMIGVGLFLLGSFLSGLSGDMFQLILFRGIQGLGAGAIFPIALAVIGDLFSPQERGRYQGLFGAVFGLSALLGPALGGLLTDTIGWHWVFFVNLPIGAVAMAIIWRLLPGGRPEGVTRRVDYLGVALFTAALVPILIGLTNKQTLDWLDPWVGGLLGIGLIIGLLFLWVESRAAEPIVPLALFRDRTYAGSMAAVFLASFGFFAAIIFLPRWFQVVNGSSATESGYQVLPLLAGLILSSVVSGALVSRTGRYKGILLGALICLAVGLWLSTGLRADTELPILWAWMFITGVGIGPTLSVYTIVVQNAVPRERLGVATSNLTFFRQVGGTVGLAIAGTIFGTTLSSETPRQLRDGLLQAGVPADRIDSLQELASGRNLDQDDLAGVGDLGARILDAVPEALRSTVEPFLGVVVEAIHEAFSLAVGETFWLGVLATVAAIGATFLIRDQPLRGPVEVPQATAGASVAS
ncbi:MAG: MFS transporter [Chloroflexota bacterium]|nr:MFS transporter [Chloroflexota bacterium]